MEPIEKGGGGSVPPDRPDAHWQHYNHVADIGVRGYGKTSGQAFEQAAIALTAVICDPELVVPRQEVEIFCQAPDLEFLLTDWLNALIYEMATRHMLFSRFAVEITGMALHGKAWGEEVDVGRHAPSVEVKGATFTTLKVRRNNDASWIAQCVVDV